MIDTATLGFALGAGLVAALNPCGFAFLPGYLGLVIAGDTSAPSRPAALARAGAATVAMSSGFLTVFGVFGVVISPVASSAQRYLPFATVVIGVLLIALALWLLSGRDVVAMVPRLTGGTPTARLSSMYGYGVGYAVASLSCTIAPFLAMLGATFRHGDIVTGLLGFLAYGAGMSITVGVAALIVALVGSGAGTGIRRMLPYINPIAGMVVLLTGLYVTYYGVYEIRLFFGGGGAADPVIEAAGAVQGWLAGVVDSLGAWALIGVLAVLIAAAFAWQVVKRRGSASGGRPGSDPGRQEASDTP